MTTVVNYFDDKFVKSFKRKFSLKKLFTMT